MRLTAQIECINTSILLLSGFLMVSFTALFEYSTLIFLLRKEVFLAKKNMLFRNTSFRETLPELGLGATRDGAAWGRSLGGRMLAAHAPRVTCANPPRGAHKSDVRRQGRKVTVTKSTQSEQASGETTMASSTTPMDKEAASVNLFRNYELRTVFAPTEKRRLPTTLITGWLGSGKTTVMRHVLQNSQDLKVACLVNDFAELNIDAELVARENNNKSNNNVVELTNGCLCCTLGGELEQEVWRMLDVAGKAGVNDPSSSSSQIEYLLIETSGLVDPTDTVASLDKTFGKMARVRLDSVVCVVDAESAAAGGALGPDAFASMKRDAKKGNETASKDISDAWAKQLAAADVVLLNKIDLLGEDGDGKTKTEKLLAARRFISEWAPNARVVECVKGKVPLPQILDVELEPQPEGKFGHDWDSAERRFLLSPSGGGLRKELSDVSLSKTPSGPFKLDPIDPTRRVSHVPDGNKTSSDFGSVSFECGAVSLCYFQRWVKSGIPQNAVRAKGFVTFCENPGVQYDFHLSGKRRVEIEQVDASIQTKVTRPKNSKSDAPETRLVLIGPAMDPAVSLDALQEMERDSAQDNASDSINSIEKIAKRVQWAKGLIQSDSRLELVEADESWCVTQKAMTSCVYFRLTGAELNAMTFQSMEKEHGVDFNKMNVELVQVLNSSGIGATATTTTTNAKTHFGSDVVLVRVAVGAEDGSGGCLDAWAEVQPIVGPVLQRHIGHIPKCRCGF